MKGVGWEKNQTRRKQERKQQRESRRRGHLPTRFPCLFSAPRHFIAAIEGRTDSHSLSSLSLSVFASSSPFCPTVLFPLFPFSFSSFPFFSDLEDLVLCLRVHEGRILLVGDLLHPRLHVLLRERRGSGRDLRNHLVNIEHSPIVLTGLSQNGNDEISQEIDTLCRHLVPLLLLGVCGHPEGRRRLALGLGEGGGERLCGGHVEGSALCCGKLSRLLPLLLRVLTPRTRSDHLTGL
mmetsp:Transcript_30003/g.58864  ORF Transcript_30003/g.58864 Transcript_30003/m.58864 type:complete len:236 (-) Transcript_30003:677-1384(-)